MGTLRVPLAPENLWQAINPWSFYQQGARFGFINIDLGAARRCAEGQGGSISGATARRERTGKQ